MAGGRRVTTPESRLIGLFPRLRITPFRITSPRAVGYNCIAWAAGDDNNWWQPDSLGIYYWPLEDRTPTIDGYVAAFKSRGYEVCADGSLEAHFEKVAIYAGPNGEPLHAARQLASGEWTSKLGKLYDISHSLDGLEGQEYGQVKIFLRRPRP